MNPIIREIVNAIKTGLGGVSCVEGLVVHGNCASGDEDFYSDIDLIAYMKDGETKPQDIDLVKNRILTSLAKMNEKVLFEWDKNDKWVIHTEQNFVKMEVAIKSISHANKDLAYIVESGVDSPEKVVILDRQGKVTQTYKKNWINLKNRYRLRREFIDNAKAFVYYYDPFLSQFTRGDIYRAYMNCTIAFYKLASLIAIGENVSMNLCQPRYLTRGIAKDDATSKRLYSAIRSIL